MAQAATTRARNSRTIEDVPEYSSAPASKTAGAKKKTEQPFKFDGKRYVLLRPKMVITLNMLRLKDGEDSLDAGWDMIGLLSSLIGYIKVEPPSPDGTLNGRAHLMSRLSDPTDTLDLPDLAQPFMELMDRVFDRPTGSPAGSSNGPASNSRAGGGGTRTRRAVTSTA